MLFKLFLLFTIVPVAELSVLIKIGSHIGTVNTIAIVLLTAIIGAYMVRLEGVGVLYRMQQNMQDGVFPRDELLDGVMILLAGALLLTPGFITDIFGFLMVFPFSRKHIRTAAARYINRKISSGDIHIDRH